MRKLIIGCLTLGISFVGGYAMADRAAAWTTASATVDIITFARTSGGKVSARVCGHADDSTGVAPAFRDCTDSFELTSGSTIETQVLTLMNGQGLAKWKAVFGF